MLQEKTALEKKEGKERENFVQGKKPKQSNKLCVEDDEMSPKLLPCASNLCPVKWISCEVKKSQTSISSSLLIWARCHINPVLDPDVLHVALITPPCLDNDRREGITDARSGASRTAFSAQHQPHKISILLEV